MRTVRLMSLVTALLLLTAGPGGFQIRAPFRAETISPFTRQSSAGSLSSVPFADSPVNVRVTIRGISARDCMDEFGAVCGSDPDFYAIITIGDATFNNEDTPEQERYEDEDVIFPDWEFSSSVDPSIGSIPIVIEIRDEDGGLRFDDDHVDLDPDDGDRNLELALNLNTCIISGDISGECGVILSSEGNEDDRAFIWVIIDVERPPAGASRMRVRCTHTPIWPQGSDTVTFRAEALESPTPIDANNHTPLTADAIEIWLNDTTAPVQVCTSATDCSVTRGPFPASSTIVYGCRVRHGGDEVWSGWRRVQIGMPVQGRAIPVLYTGPRNSSIDILFIPDRDSYPSGGMDPQFQLDVASVITNAYYAEDIYLIHQDKLNFWIALDTGKAEPYEDGCDHEVPDNWDEEYAFVDVGAILHTDNFRDCAPGGEPLFSSEPTSLRTVLHETGHRPFGLADEYCCDGGYYQASPFPNVYAEPGDCQNPSEISDLAGWDTLLGQTPRTASACREFEEDRFWFFDRDWSVSDPPSNDLMVDNGNPQGADIRRIDWRFNEICRRAGC